MTTTYSDLQYETAEGIATITIDRPETYNALRYETMLELNEAVRTADADDGVYAMVLTGAETDGTPAFSAGADLGEDMDDVEEQTEEEYRGVLGTIQNIVRQLRDAGTPSVAAVNGVAIGAGSGPALASDVRVVGPDARIREGFVKVGLIPGDGSGWLLPKLVGESRARQYLLTGRDIDADAAVEMGLAVERAEDPLEAAHEFAAELRDLPATAVQNTNRLVSLDGSIDDYFSQAAAYQWECFQDEEHHEALAAFSEKRDPDYERDYA
jgi:enoyl-CoA hydratase/carnithine racemase